MIYDNRGNCKFVLKFNLCTAIIVCEKLATDILIMTIRWESNFLEEGLNMVEFPNVLENLHVMDIILLVSRRKGKGVV